MSFLFPSGGGDSNLIIPEGEKPKAFQTVIPQKSYKDLAESMGRTETEYNRLLDTRYDMTGTGAQLGAKQRGIVMQEAASYRSSLPAASSPDTSFKATPRPFDITSKGLPEKMYPGMIISYKVSPLLNIKMNWVTEITQVKDKHFFIDEQRLGPYKMWHHQHFFERKDKCILMTDIVTYIPPFGILGDIANVFLIKKDFQHFLQ